MSSGERVAILIAGAGWLGVQGLAKAVVEGEKRAGFQHADRCLTPALAPE